MESKLTVAFTTIDRNDDCKSALNKLRDLLPGVRILVADQNDPTFEMKNIYEEKEIDFRFIGKDVGLSAARNKIFRETTTPYLLLCDDDLVDISVDEVWKSVAFMESRQDVLAVGGRASKLRNENGDIKELVNPDFDYFILNDDDKDYASFLSIHKFGMESATLIEDGYFLADVVENFVIFNVDNFRELGLAWDERIKIKNEHLDFYLSLKRNPDTEKYKVIYNPRLIVSEFDGITDRENHQYTEKRTRNNYTSIYCEKWGIYQEFHIGKWINLYNGSRFVSVPWEKRKAFSDTELNKYQDEGLRTKQNLATYPVDERKITFMATTMSRYEVAESYIISARNRFPDSAIILGVQADNLSTELQDIGSRYNAEIILLGKDIGLSRARNIMLDHVGTEYFVLCDDDFVIDDEFFLNNAVKVLDENPDIGVVGGYYRDIIFDRELKFTHAQDRQFTMRFEFEPKTRTLVRIPFNYIPFERQFDEDTRCVPVDCVNNLALFRRSLFDDPQVRWDERMKISGEHIDFYFNLYKKGGVKIVYDPSFSVLHNRRQNMEYVKYRNRRDGISLFYEKWNIDNEVDFDFGIKKISNGVDLWTQFSQEGPC